MKAEIIFGVLMISVLMLSGCNNTEKKTDVLDQKFVQCMGFCKDKLDMVGFNSGSPEEIMSCVDKCYAPENYCAPKVSMTTRVE